MEWLKKLNLKGSDILKLAGLAIVGIILVAAAIRLIGGAVDSVRARRAQDTVFSTLSAITTGGSVSYKESAAQDLSIRNVAGTPIAPSYNGTAGADAEAYEITDYRANIESRDAVKTCGEISALKSRDDVIFESSSEYDRGCDYAFKVKKDSAAGVLEFVKGLDPEELVESTQTIKNTVDDFTSQTEILTNKLKAIDETMAKAMTAYDEVTVLATKAQDAGSLAKIIDSKVNIIERLSQERINISAQLEQIGRAKAEQLDRLDYTRFSLGVRENKYVDGDNLKESWRSSLRNFVQDVNRIAQDLSVNLVAWSLALVQYLVYFFILLFVAKYVWRLAKRIWQR